jgi:hypothetical protein
MAAPITAPVRSFMSWNFSILFYRVAGVHFLPQRHRGHRGIVFLPDRETTIQQKPAALRAGNEIVSGIMLLQKGNANGQ